MNSRRILSPVTLPGKRGVPQRVSSLIMLLQRSPLAQLLPEARIITDPGFSRLAVWSITAIAGLGAFDSVSGASSVAQLSPSSGSFTVNGTGGQALAFLFNYTGSDTPDHFQVIGTLPPGLSQTKTTNSKSDSITGVPLAAGSFPVTVKAWRDAAQSSNSVSANFTINLAAPPAPAITASPAPAVATTGGLAILSVTQTNGFTFTWKRNGVALPSGETILTGRAAPRKYLVPVLDPGTSWRTDTAFPDSTWTSVQGGIGYDTNTSGVNFLPFIASGGNVQSLMSNKSTSALIRIPFSLTPHAALSYLKLRVQCDDGFVAWLNGTEVASQGKPASLTWKSASTTSADDNGAITFREIDIPMQLGLLHAGDNLLAVQAMNQATSSSDLLFNCELAGGINAVNSPKLVLTGIEPQDAGVYTVTVTNTTSAVTSDPAPVVLPPEINSEPVPVTIASGATALLSVVASSSSGLQYQWYTGTSGDTAHPLEGAAGASFTTPALGTTTTYWVRITNAAGSVDSSTVTVTVNGAADPFTAWRNAQFSAADAVNDAVSGPTADPDGDGLTNTQEYVFGTLPGQPDTAALTVAAGQSPPAVSFTALAATGAGYEGRTRLYTLESTTDLAGGTWAAVADFTGITGAGQTVTYTPPAGVRTFLRLKVQLTP